MLNEKIFTVPDVEHLVNPVKEVLSLIKDELNERGVIVFLHGDLATGKTAFVQEFARFVGVESRVQSPTFTLMKSYDVDSDLIPELYKIVHIDAYRLEPHHKEALRVDEFINEPGTLVFIEWPSAIELDSSLAYLNIDFFVVSEMLRKVIVRHK